MPFGVASGQQRKVGRHAGRGGVGESTYNGIKIAACHMICMSQEGRC